MPSAEAISIRNATQHDVGTILQFIRKIATFEKLEGEVVNTEQLLRAHLFGPHPAAECFLFEDDRKAIGFAIVFRTFSTFTGRVGLWLEDLYIDEEYRRCGIGRKVIRYLADLAQKRDYARFEWTALKWNQNAIDLYLDEGATKMDDWVTFRMDLED
ncbi:MAG: GNAT family N-acetyltransferase [Phycisphaerales bacterium]|jgi:GNAT superfamily N-acetyltransferase|nr:GNAT family N-acetyltransferase [Phycisphaerales bacterium]MBT7170483.1 GNAT family N-acetyltransferase [Phycisphaerales bacterium]